MERKDLHRTPLLGALYGACLVIAQDFAIDSIWWDTIDRRFDSLAYYVRSRSQNIAFQ